MNDDTNMRAEADVVRAAINAPDLLNLVTAQDEIEAAAERNAVDIHSVNRAARRQRVRDMKRMVRNPVGMATATHPLLREKIAAWPGHRAMLTPHGLKVLKRRRAAAVLARRSRRINAGGYRGHTVDAPQARPFPRKAQVAS